jgi:GNAT superfamily N-acetyltransferase
MNIRHAREDEAEALSAIAFKSKAHWKYSAATLATWREELTISPSEIASRPTYVAHEDGELAGFCVLIPEAPHWTLEHLWVLPRHMGRGVGRALLEHAAHVAVDGGADALTIDSDPYAEPFYLACGAQRVGSVAAPIEGSPERVLPKMLLPTPSRDRS